MTTQLQKLYDEFRDFMLEFRDLKHEVAGALAWITAHDSTARELARTHADSKTWFWRTVFASVIVFLVGGALNGMVMIIGIIVSLLLNDKFTAFLGQLAFHFSPIK